MLISPNSSIISSPVPAIAEPSQAVRRMQQKAAELMQNQQITQEKLQAAKESNRTQHAHWQQERVSVQTDGLFNNNKDPAPVSEFVQKFLEQLQNG
jgi:hypothetical protein